MTIDGFEITRLHIIIIIIIIAIVIKPLNTRKYTKFFD